MFNDTAIARFKGPWGVPIEIGGTLILLVFLIFGLNGQPDFYTFTFIAVIVGSILLHELGHAWGCVVQGIPVARVMLYGGGGYCQPARAPTNRQNELIVAMGPIVNIALWALASLALRYVETEAVAIVLWQIMIINLILFGLNMLPVQPLDGGKLLHLGLLRVMGAELATRIAGFIGLVVAILWIPAMIAAIFYFGIFLLFFPPIGLHWRMMRGE